MSIQMWQHQKETIEIAKNRKEFALLWEMGTGKSFCTINIIKHNWKENGRVLRTLILAPPIVLSNWERELKELGDIPKEYINVLNKTGKHRKEHVETMIKAQRSGIIITNYESMQMKELVDLLKAWRPEIVVCDESHRCKSPTSKRAKVVYEISRYATYRYILTGTPILNNAQDLFMQFKILDNGATFGENFYAFRAKFFYDANSSWAHRQNHFPLYRIRPEMVPVVGELIANKSTRVLKKDCLDLPPLIRQQRFVELSAEQKRLYKDMKENFIAFINEKLGEGKSNATVAELAMTKGLRLQQIVTGYCMLDNGSIHTIEDNPRISCLKELLEEITPENKVIVWACFKENYKAIAKLCREMNIEYAEVHGEIKKKDKEIEKFKKNDKCKVLIANQASAGIGINLVEASYSIYYSKDFSLENDYQSEARNYRGGSEIHEKVTRIDIVANDTIDTLILNALKNKQKISELIVDMRNIL